MSEQDPNWAKIERRLGIAFFVNFLSFCVISVMIGGDAINGRIDGTSHILSAQGNETIVAPLIWYYSAMHAYIVIGSFVLFFAYLIRKRLSNQRS